MRFPRRALLIVPVLVMSVVLAVLPTVSFGVQSTNFWAKADGYHEILSPTAGAINTNGFATLKTMLNDATGTITFRFEFSGLTTPLVQAHYHFSQEHVSGGVMVFLCGPAGSPAKQTCDQNGAPATSGVVSGTLTAADVIGPVPQNILAGDMASVMAAIRNGAAYVNLHTTMFPGGEIRGQIQD